MQSLCMKMVIGSDKGKKDLEDVTSLYIIDLQTNYRKKSCG